MVVMIGPNIIVETDASLLGWGTVSEAVHTNGLWSENERSLSFGVDGRRLCSKNVCPSSKLNINKIGGTLTLGTLISFYGSGASREGSKSPQNTTQARTM